jgi:hypothetical protein
VLAAAERVAALAVVVGERVAVEEGPLVAAEEAIRRGFGAASRLSSLASHKREQSKRQA